MKKYILGAIFSFGVLVPSTFAQAAILSNSQIQSILSLLSSFGADSATIANVRSVLVGGTSAHTLSSSGTTQNIKSYDVVIYGGTSAGVTAAVEAARTGETVAIIEPSNHLGGMTSNGLGATDIGNLQTVGGIAKEFYQDVLSYYNNSANWQYGQNFDAYKNLAANFGYVGTDTMMSFEPHVAENIFKQFIQTYNIPVFYGQRLNLDSGVTKSGSTITQIVMESGMIFKAQMFIDASYEGDLMAKAGVSYTVGRESDSIYGETLNGVIFNPNGPHQFASSVDPYVIKGNPSSGLLPGINSNPGTSGQGDNKVQAYNFRLCTTDVPQNAIPWSKPAGYDPSRYELLLRYFDSGYGSNVQSSDFGYNPGTPWAFLPMPNLKTDTNNNGPFSTDNIGMNYDYPDGDYTTRENIIRDQISYQQGLFWTLATNPRVPQNIRNEINKWGLCKDEFTDNGGWPDQIYVREGRRMISDYVMTESNSNGSRNASDSVGMGSYPIDSHNVQRYLTSGGTVQNEGDLVGLSGTNLAAPYPISYRSIVPKKQEVTNLLDPVTLSASHVAYGSMRTEPILMILGQSAGAAASIAIDDNVAVQNVNYNELKQQLVHDGQILGTGGPAAAVHCQRCSVNSSYQWVNFDSTDSSCASVVPSTNPVTRTCNCSCPGNVGNSYPPDCSAQCKACTDTTWSPDPSTVCSGQSFTQTSNCGTTRTAAGTENCAPVSVHCGRCSTVMSYQWASFDSTDPTCATVVPSTNPVTRTCNCSCPGGLSNTLYPPNCSSQCTAPSVVNVSGVWNKTAGTVQSVWTLSQSGSSVSGTSSSGATITSGSIGPDGHSISLTWSNGYRFNATVSSDGNSMSGTQTNPDGTSGGTWSATRSTASFLGGTKQTANALGALNSSSGSQPTARGGFLNAVGGFFSRLVGSF